MIVGRRVENIEVVRSILTHTCVCGQSHMSQIWPERLNYTIHILILSIVISPVLAQAHEHAYAQTENIWYIVVLHSSC